jgi:PPM family protein phosphatase
MSDFGAQTFTGVRHQTNEDAYGAVPARGVWVVADGMGGHAAGEVASQVTRDRVVAEVRRGAAITASIAAAHEAVVQAATEVQARKGMGSTVVAAQIEKRTGQAHIAWVGDSRAYLWRGGELRRLTRDHSLVQLMVQQGEISPAEAETHPDRNVLVRCLGFDHPQVDQVQLHLEPGDLLLLCTDGLTTEVKDARLAEILASTPSPQACADALIRAVEARQGVDDATAVVIRYGGRPNSWLPVLAGLAAGLAAFMIWMWMRSQ